jgi:hypothetical protein
MRLAMFEPIKHDQSNVYRCIKLLFCVAHSFYEQRYTEGTIVSALFHLDKNVVYVDEEKRKE